MEKLAAYRARMAVQQPPPHKQRHMHARIAAEFLEHCKLLKVEIKSRIGSARWNLTTDMRKDATGIYAAAWNKVAPGGSLPSGHSQVDATKKMRQ